MEEIHRLPHNPPPYIVAVQEIEDPSMLIAIGKAGGTAEGFVILQDHINKGEPHTHLIAWSASHGHLTSILRVN